MKFKGPYLPAKLFLLFSLTSCSVSGSLYNALQDQAAPSFLFSEFALYADIFWGALVGLLVGIFLGRKRTILRVLTVIAPLVFLLLWADTNLWNFILRDQVWEDYHLYSFKIAFYIAGPIGLLIAWLKRLERSIDEDNKKEEKKKKKKKSKNNPPQKSGKGEKSKAAEIKKLREEKEIKKLRELDKEELLEALLVHQNLKMVKRILSIEPKELSGEYIIKCPNETTAKSVMNKIHHAETLSFIAQNSPMMPIRLQAFSKIKQERDKMEVINAARDPEFLSGIFAKGLLNDRGNEIKLVKRLKPEPALLNQLKDRYSSKELYDLYCYWDSAEALEIFLPKFKPEIFSEGKRLELLKQGLDQEMRDRFLHRVSPENILMLSQEFPQWFESESNGTLVMASLIQLKDFETLDKTITRDREKLEYYFEGDPLYSSPAIPMDLRLKWFDSEENQERKTSFLQLLDTDDSLTLYQQKPEIFSGGKGLTKLLDAAKNREDWDLFTRILTSSPALCKEFSGEFPYLRDLMEEGQNSHFKSFISKNPELLTHDFGNFCGTPVYMAVEKGNLELVKICGMLNPECLSQAREEEETTPAFAAAALNHVPLVEYLLAKAPESFKTPNHEGTLLMGHIAQEGSLDVIKAILKKQPQLMGSKDGNGFTPAYTAVQFNQKEVVERLMEAIPESFSISCGNGNNPAHLAVGMGHFEIYEIIAGTLPDLVEIKNDAGNSAAAFYEEEKERVANEAEYTQFPCSQCFQQVSIPMQEGASLQCPNCYNAPTDEKIHAIPAEMIQTFWGLDFAAVDCNCPECGKLNRSILVPPDKVFATRYAQKLDDTDGSYRVRHRCIYCGKDYNLALE